MSGISVPGYWMHETSGVLAPAVQAYLEGRDLSRDEVAAMRAYLRQWIAAPWLDLTGDLTSLRLGIDVITTSAGLRDWLRRALELGIDPL
jgi:hypothetical protein